MLRVLLALLSTLPFVLGQGDDYYTNGNFVRRFLRLTQVPNDIPEDAITVDLGSNSLELLPERAFFGLSRCTGLFVAWNLITDIEPGAFEGLPNLTTLSLYQNMLPTLKSGMFKGLYSLQTLTLSNNPITTWQNGTWEGLQNLKKLYLYGNYLKFLKANAFAGLDSLDELTLTFNKIVTIEPGAFVGLARLEKLWLDNNKVLTNITKEMFTGLDSLYRMSIHTNNISSIGGVFTGLKNLEELDVDDNKISAVNPDAFHGLNRLTKVWLYNNNLTTLTASVFSDLPRQLDLTIGGNPLVCDKRLCWIKKGEKEGWLRWIQFENRPLKPNCTNGIHWDDLQLDCAGIVECPHPGGISHGVRGESHYPYTPTSTVPYRCKPCYRGGGTITCQNNGTWSEKPVCSPITCDAPPHLPNAHTVPDKVNYACGHHVTYICHYGYALQGDASIICRENRTFNGSHAVCVPTDSNGVPIKLLPLTSKNSDGSNNNVTWIAIGVGSLFVVLIIVALVIVVVRRRRPGEQRAGSNMTTGGEVGATGGGGSLAEVSDGNGFINKAAMLQEEELSYADLQKKEGIPEDYLPESSDGYSRQTSAASGGGNPLDPPEYDLPSTPPEYTPSNSFSEYSGK